jgi:ABC-type bacteriocin/lantibiotic exporter with double-glycine peptidase domain
MPRPPFSRRRIVRIRQHDPTDCAAACLSSIAAHYGTRIPLPRIRDLACTDQRGTTVLGLVRAAETLGFLAKGVRGTYQSLAAVPKPVVAHLDLGGGLQHYVVLYAITPKYVVLMDPADGQVHRVPPDDFRARWTGVLVLAVPAEGFAPLRRVGSGVRRLYSLLVPHRTILVQSLVGAGFHTMLGLSTAVYVQQLVDRAVPDGNRSLVNLMGVAMLAVLAVQLTLAWSRDRITLATGQKIDAALILAYHRRLLELPQRFFDTRRIGEITSRLGDAVKIRSFINDVALDLAISAGVVVLSLALMLTYSRSLALVAFAAMPLYALIYRISDHLNRSTQREVMERAADVEAELVEGLQAAATIRSFGAESWAALRVEVRLVRMLRAVYRSGINSIGATTALTAVSRMVTIALLWIGAGLVISRALTLGELMSFYALSGYLTGPVVALVAANRSIQDALIAADRLFEIMDLDREEAEPGPALLESIRGDIRFEGVTFRYGVRPPIFTDLSLTIRDGQMTAIVGESGSGKTTIAALLQRLYPLETGRLTIGGRDLRHFSRSSLRRRIGVVPQQVRLLPTTVAANIALGEPEPDLERMLELCDQLGVTAFVDRLPAGFRTALGAEGASLSGGERQRLAIARALYRDPQIVIFDEATSSLDPASEGYVRDAVERIRRAGKTIVMISHRLTSIMDADRIVVLGGGSVLEQGSHGELLERAGPYRDLWSSQHPPEITGRRS